MRRELKILRGQLTPAEFEEIHAFSVSVRTELRSQAMRLAVLDIENRALRAVVAKLLNEVDQHLRGT